MEKELTHLHDLDVHKPFFMTDVPAGQNVIGWMYILKLKYDDTFKAIFIDQGWNQIYGGDCYRTYAPRCRLQSIRMVLAVAAEMNWEVVYVNVSTAFLYASFQ